MYEACPIKFYNYTYTIDDAITKIKEIDFDIDNETSKLKGIEKQLDKLLQEMISTPQIVLDGGISRLSEERKIFTSRSVIEKQREKLNEEKNLCIKHLDKLWKDKRILQEELKKRRNRKMTYEEFEELVKKYGDVILRYKMDIKGITFENCGRIKRIRYFKECLDEKQDDIELCAEKFNYTHRSKDYMQVGVGWCFESNKDEVCELYNKYKETLENTIHKFTTIKSELTQINDTVFCGINDFIINWAIGDAIRAINEIIDKCNNKGE